MNMQSKNIKRSTHGAAMAKPAKPNEVPVPGEKPEIIPPEEPEPNVWPRREPETQPGKEPLTTPPTAPPEVPTQPKLDF
jgi:hypothetical protein